MNVPFQSTTVERTASITLNGPSEATFPLFGPVREADWAEGWAPEVLTPGPLRPGWVFRTRDEQRGETLWLMTDYDEAARHVSYVRVTPSSDVTAITVRVCDEGTARSTAEIGYSFTAVTPDGTDYVRTFTEEHYRRWIASWGEAINHYLATGELLRRQ